MSANDGASVFRTSVNVWTVSIGESADETLGQGGATLVTTSESGVELITISLGELASTVPSTDDGETMQSIEVATPAL